MWKSHILRSSCSIVPHFIKNKCFKNHLEESEQMEDSTHLQIDLNVFFYIWCTRWHQSNFILQFWLFEQEKLKHTNVLQSEKINFAGSVCMCMRFNSLVSSKYSNLSRLIWAKTKVRTWNKHYFVGVLPFFI